MSAMDTKIRIKVNHNFDYNLNGVLIPIDPKEDNLYYVLDLKSFLIGKLGLDVTLAFDILLNDSIVPDWAQVSIIRDNETIELRKVSQKSSSKPMVTKKVATNQSQTVMTPTVDITSPDGSIGETVSTVGTEFMTDDDDIIDRYRNKTRAIGYQTDSKRSKTSYNTFIRKRLLTDNHQVGDSLESASNQTVGRKQYKWRELPFDLLRNKNSIEIQRQIRFDKMKINSYKTIKVWIKNLSSESQTLVSVENEDEDNQISFNAFQKTYGKSAGTEPPFEIPANTRVYIELKCNAKSNGLETELLLFKFNGFVIGRCVHITGDESSPSNRVQNHSNQNLVADNGSNGLQNRSRIVLGKKLWPQIQLDNLPHFDIPSPMILILENNCPIEDRYPEYRQELVATNYRKKFHTLLWIEEFQNRKDLSQYNRYNISIKKEEQDFYSIIVPGLSQDRPKLIIGDKIHLIKTDDPNSPTYQGYIHELKENEILVPFGEEFHRNYTTETKFNLKFQLSRTVYRRRHHAIDLIVNFPKETLFPNITNVNKKETLESIHSKSIDWFNQSLNERQKIAVLFILKGQFRPSPYMIFGPPGTGKTVTIVESILQVFKRIAESRIIVCTAANSSADLIVQKLLDSKQISETDLIRITAFHRIKTIPKCLQSVTKLADEEPEKWLFNKRIIITTTSQAGVIYRHVSNSNFSPFTHVFIDEAAQVMEPESLIPITLSKRGEAVLVLAGDHKQLGPVIHSNKAKEKQLDCSLIERLIDYQMNDKSLYKRDKKYEKYGEFNPRFITKLIQNYRSDAQIMFMSSKLFYESELLFNVNPDQKLLNDMNLKSAINFHGVKGKDIRCPVLGSQSWFNSDEVFKVCFYLDKLYQNGVKPEDIGIITPYRSQVSSIYAQIIDKGLTECSVSTIEKFQGLEKRVIIVSMVRSVPNEFLLNPKRSNVAVSRAMSLIIIIGNPSVLSRDKFWSKLIDYCIDNNGYSGCPFRDYPD